MNDNESFGEDEYRESSSESGSNSSSPRGEIKAMTEMLEKHLIDEINTSLTYDEGLNLKNDESTILNHSAFKIGKDRIFDTNTANYKDAFQFSTNHSNACFQGLSSNANLRQNPMSSMYQTGMSTYQPGFNCYPNNYYYGNAIQSNFATPIYYQQPYVNFSSFPTNPMMNNNIKNGKIKSQKKEKPLKKNNKREMPKKNKQAKEIDIYTCIEEFIIECENPVDYINSQQGSKNMQSLLAFLPMQSNQIADLLDKLGNGIISIIKDSYGNYFVQKLIKLLDPDSFSDLLGIIIKNNIAELANHQYANHIIKSLIENFKSEQQESRITTAITPYYREMAFNIYGTHVLQSIMINFRETTKMSLISYVEENFYSLSMDINGVCLVKKYIIISTSKDINFKLNFINKAYLFLPKLINSPAGNFAISCMLEEWGLGVCSKITSYFENNIYSLTGQKYSSLLLVKCIELAEPVRKLYL